ncbi:MAG: hypothetical protein JXA14_20180, partial [Anaerolineae bacterium]|nr:hypothetical protein [Anaerolineae bacterium]
MSEHLSDQSSSTNAQSWTCLNCGKENRSEHLACWSCHIAKDSPSETSPTTREHSQTPQVLKTETPRADSPPPSDDLSPDSTAAKFDFKIALQAGVIGAVAEFALSFLLILATTSISAPFTPSSFVHLPLVMVIAFLPWFVNIATGALYVYIAKRKGKVIGTGMGALGGAITGIIYLLADSGLNLILNYITDVVLDSPVRFAAPLSPTIWEIALALVPTVFLSTIGGLVYAAFAQTKTSAASVLRMIIGCVAGFVGLIVGFLGLQNLLGDSNALGCYCNMPV